MSSPRWRQIKKLVDAALDRDPSERARFLDEFCPDPEIRKEVESLLAHEQRDFLERAAWHGKETPGADLVGETLSHYEIVGRIGRGGMGEVFLAQDTTLDRRVALKFLPESLQQDETAKRRFLREAKSAAALDHPYICKIYEIGDADGRSFIAMEYVHGETLADHLARAGLTLEAVRRIAAEIAEALELAHSEGIVHRDLKPSNIMITTGGHVKVLDFGLAKRVAPASKESQFETASRLTEGGAALGTAAYMSPEQHRLEVADARSDIFAFGVILYEMLAGVHPFARATGIDTASAILNEDPAPLSHHRREVPEAVEHIVSKALAKSPEDRYQLVHELRTDLLYLKEPSATRTRTTAGRRRWLQLAAASVALVVTTAGLLALLTDSPDGPRSAGTLPSVAVLPLTNISDHPRETDYLADGISQAVTMRLAQAGLRVTPWETARRFKNSTESAEVIASRLNVDAVLAGTFQISEDQILTTVSLVDARSGFVSWADAIVESYDDIFRMQRRIAIGVAESLKKELTGEEERALATPESENTAAYDYYLQGSEIFQEGGEEATEVAFQYFNRAAELDPSFAEAHVGLGAVHHDRYVYGWGGLMSLEQAKESYERALELSRQSVQARRGLIMLNFMTGTPENCLMQKREAERFGSPEDVEILLARSEAFLCVNEIPPALPLLERARALDPLNAETYFWLTAGPFAFAPEDALEAGETYLQLFGDYRWVHTFMAFSHQLLENYEQALEHYEKAGRDPSLPSDPELAALVYGGILLDELGEPEKGEAFWRQGIALVQPKLEAHPDNVRMRLFLACFQGLLGERDAFRREEKKAFEHPRVAAQQEPLEFLVAVHARLGETEKMIELVRRIVEAGRVTNYFEHYVRLAFAAPVESDALDDLVQRAETERQRLLDEY